jgi:Fur family ferric uptake transcriptional regulator
VARLSPFARNKAGTITVRLRNYERSFLSGITNEFIDILKTDDPDLARLFPTVYADPDLEREYQGFMHDELRNGRAAALRTLLDTISNKRITIEEGEQWMRCFNDLRLFLGSRLEITDDWHDHVGPDDPNAEQFGIYSFLTMIVAELVEVLHGPFDEPTYFESDEPESTPPRRNPVSADAPANAPAREPVFDESRLDDHDLGDFVVPDDLSGLIDPPRPDAHTQDDEIKRRLRDANLRATAGRTRVIEVMKGSAQPASVPEIQLLVGDEVPLSTLYRIIADLVDARVLRKLEFAEGFARYELDEDLAAHHHHLVCTVCGTVTDLSLDDLETQLDRTAVEILRTKGFITSAHRLDFFGTCEECLLRDRSV